VFYDDASYHDADSPRLLGSPAYRVWRGTLAVREDTLLRPQKATER